MKDIALAVLYCGTAFALAFLVLLSLPQSRLRAVLLPVFQWGFVLLCGVYVLSPVDFVPEIALGPFGIVDDGGALVAGLLSARSALRPGRFDPSRN